MRNYACALLLSEGRVLLGLRAPHRKAYAGKWDVIGGLVEPGETLEQALGRELGEELGIVPTSWTPVGSVLDEGPEARGVAAYHMFAVHDWSGGAPRMMDDEHTAIAWFGIDAACALPGLALEEYRDVFTRLRPLLAGARPGRDGRPGDGGCMPGRSKEEA